MENISSSVDFWQAVSTLVAAVRNLEKRFSKWLTPEPDAAVRRWLLRAIENQRRVEETQTVSVSSANY
jgi:hypothetical protein